MVYHSNVPSNTGYGLILLLISDWSMMRCKLSWHAYAHTNIIQSLDLFSVFTKQKYFSIVRSTNLTPRENVEEVANSKTPVNKCSTTGTLTSFQLRILSGVRQQKIYGAAMMFFWMFFSSISLWFATCLSVFYCLRISGFTQSCFLWLKFRIPKLIPWLLLGSLLASVIIAFLCVEVDYPKDAEEDTLRNTTLKKSKTKIRKVSEVLLVNLVLIFPLAIFVMCTSMLLISLYKHAHRMKHGPHGFRNASTEAHINALKTVITFFCFFISYFAAFMTNMTFSLPYRSQQFFLLKDIMAAYPSGHSVIIILSHPKFQQPFRRILCLKKK